MRLLIHGQHSDESAVHPDPGFSKMSKMAVAWSSMSSAIGERTLRLHTYENTLGNFVSSIPSPSKPHLSQVPALRSRTTWVTPSKPLWQWPRRCWSLSTARAASRRSMENGLVEHVGCPSGGSRRLEAQGMHYLN